MQALVIRISRDVYVLDITVNFMLNKRMQKQKSGWGFAPDPTSGAISVPPDPLSVTGGGMPPQVVNIFIRPPLSQNPGSAPGTHVLAEGEVPPDPYPLGGGARWSHSHGKRFTCLYW